MRTFITGTLALALGCAACGVAAAQTTTHSRPTSTMQGAHHRTMRRHMTTAQRRDLRVGQAAQARYHGVSTVNSGTSVNGVSASNNPKLNGAH